MGHLSTQNTPLCLPDPPTSSAISSGTAFALWQSSLYVLRHFLPPAPTAPSTTRHIIQSPLFDLMLLKDRHLLLFTSIPTVPDPHQVSSKCLPNEQLVIKWLCISESLIHAIKPTCHFPDEKHTGHRITKQHHAKYLMGRATEQPRGES